MVNKASLNTMNMMTWLQNFNNYGVLKWAADGYISIHSYTKEGVWLHADKTVKSVNLNKAFMEVDGFGIKPEDARILSMMVVAKPMSTKARVVRDWYMSW